MSPPARTRSPVAAAAAWLGWLLPLACLAAGDERAAIVAERQVLQERYAASNGSSDVAVQLRTLRQSFEDILFQHGVSEFDIPTGTEVDVALRKRIAVIDSTPGKSKPRVVESCRSGFIYSRDEGHEVVLRKVEVRTSSQ